MKIGVVQAVVGSGGGNDRVLKSLLTALKKTDHDVTLYTVGKPLGKEFDSLENVRILNIVPFRIPFLGIYQNLIEMYFIKKIKNEDIVIVLTGSIPPQSRKGQRIIFYSQNNYSDPSKMDTSKYKSGFWKYYYLPYKIASKIMQGKLRVSGVEFIASSEYVKKQLHDNLGVNASVIYPPVNLTEFKNTNKSKSGVITVSRFSREKNIEKFIDLTHDMMDKHIFASVSATSTQYYFDKIMIKLIENQIKVTKNGNRSELRDLLIKSKVFLSTSDETFGIAVVEAISAGCIPIVPDRTGHVETVPFSILRPSTDLDIKERIIIALNGGYDYLLPDLCEHVKKFDESVFQSKMISLIGDNI